MLCYSVCGAVQCRSKNSKPRHASGKRQRAHAGLTGQSSISRDLEHPQLAVQWPSGRLSSRAARVVQDRVRVKARARARGQGQCTRDWRQGCPGPGSIDGGSVPCCLRCQTSPLFYSLVSCLEMDKMGRRQTRFPAVSVIHSAQLSETNRARGQGSPVYSVHCEFGTLPMCGISEYTRGDKMLGTTWANFFSVPFGRRGGKEVATCSRRDIYPGRRPISTSHQRMHLLPVLTSEWMIRRFDQTLSEEGLT